MTTDEQRQKVWSAMQCIESALGELHTTRAGHEELMRQCAIVREAATPIGPCDEVEEERIRRTVG